MENNLQNENKKHNIIMNNARELFIGGVSEVLNFDETLISLVTPLGELSIEGSELRITKYLMQSGEMCVDGKITALIYSQCKEETGKKGFLRKLSR